MTTVKFDKSVKYQGVRYAAHEVFKVADEDVDQLKSVGATVLAVDSPVTPPADNCNDKQDVEDQTSDEEIDQLKADLLERTVPELVKFAEERGIDLQHKTRKAEIYNIIVANLD